MQGTPVRAVVAGLVAVSALLVAGPVEAKPKPSAAELGRLAEVITEQYNAARLTLARAEKAKRSAEDQARLANRRYEQLRREVGSLAATSYMRPGSGSEVALFTSEDLQAGLDRSATTHYLATQQTMRLREFVLARMAAERAAAQAGDRAAEIKALNAELIKKKAKIEKLIRQIPREKSGRDAPPPNLNVPGSGKASAAVRAALTRVGKPYVYGAAGPNSFDCSGLMLWAYKQVGVSLPHYTGSQYNMGTRVTRAQLRPGDIVFFYPDLGHNGMYIGGGKMVHAPRTGKNVEVVDLASYYWGQFVGATRIS